MHCAEGKWHPPIHGASRGQNKPWEPPDFDLDLVLDWKAERLDPSMEPGTEDIPAEMIVRKVAAFSSVEHARLHNSQASNGQEGVCIRFAFDSNTGADHTSYTDTNIKHIKNIGRRMAAAGGRSKREEWMVWPMCIAFRRPGRKGVKRQEDALMADDAASSDGLASPGDPSSSSKPRTHTGQAANKVPRVQ